MKKIAVIGIPGGWSSETLADRVKSKTGFRRLVDPRSLAVDLQKGVVYNADGSLNEMDALIIKKAGAFYSPHLLDRLEMLRYLDSNGTHVFSRPESIIRVLDRISCTITLSAGNIPMPPTALTENVDQALEFVNSWGKVVLKPLYSTNARGMIVVEKGPNAEAELKSFKEDNSVIYLQQMVDHPGKDLGVAFLGGKYLATYARAGQGNSWNTTTRDGGKYQPYEPSQEIIDLAQKAQDLFNLDFTCVDVVETPEGPKIFEVSAFGGFRGLREANNIDAAALYVDYVLEKISE